MIAYCQSCSIPLEQDPAKGGTEKDGSKNGIYCSFCYDDGKFSQPNMTLQEMQKLCMDKVQGRGVPKLLAWLFTRKMHKLSRWNKK